MGRAGRSRGSFFNTLGLLYISGLVLHWPRASCRQTIVHTMPDSTTGNEPLSVTPVLLVRHSKIAYSCAPSPGLSRSDEPSAALWSLALYTNATSQTG